MSEQGGFTLLELLVVVGIIAVLGAMIVPVTEGMVKRSKADGSALSVLSVIQSARSRAVAERRNFELLFDTTTPQRIRVQRVEPGGTKTPVATVLLENGLRFHKFSGMADTPDLFGNASAIDFDGTAPVMFTSDGTLIDDNGDVVNGTIFLGVPNQTETAQAITFFGATGLVRTWRWGGAAWLD